MQIPRLVPHPALREALRFTRARPSYTAGLRAGFLTSSPLLLAPYFGFAGLAFVGLAGFGTTLVDKGGSYRTRFLTMASFGLAGTLAVFVGSALATMPWLTAPLLFGVLLACGYMRVLGAEAGSVGVFVAVVFTVSSARPAPTLLDSAESAGLFALGNLWAQLLALWVWPLRPYRPARLALVQALHALADVCGSLLSGERSAEAQRARRVLLGRTRTAIEAARVALHRSRSGRAGPTARGEALVFAVEDADVFFGALVGLEDELTRGHLLADMPALSAWAAFAERELRALSAGILREQPVVQDEFGATLAQPRIAHSHAHFGLLAQSIARIDDPRRSLPSPRVPSLQPDQPASVRALLRDNLTLGSAFLRHALRASIGSVLAYVAGSAFALSHHYWATLTCFVIMQPQSSATMAKAVQRVLGTMLGAGIAVLVASYVGSDQALAACVFVCVATAVSLLPLNYGAYAVFLTPGFVLLAEHTAGNADLSGVRVVNTCFGAGIALVCARFLFPLTEREQFRPAMAEALSALAELARTVSSTGVSRAAVHAGRRRVGLSLLNAEASHQRLLTEARVSPQEGEALLTMLLYAHRLTAALSVLGEGEERERAALIAAAPAVVRELGELADVVRGQRVRRSLPPAEEERPLRESADRLTHVQSELRVLARAIVRFSSSASSRAVGHHLTV